jgi:two-component system, OmpR family, sensor kinase
MIGRASIGEWWHKRGLVSKHATILIAVMLTVIPATFVVVFLSSRAVFLEMEQKAVAAQTARAQNSIRLFEENLSKSLGDYAEWDDSYNYLDRPNQTFEQSTLNPNTFANMGVDVITYIRFDGRPIFSRVVDSKTESVLEDESKEFAAITSSGAFFDAAKANRNHLAYVRTKRGLYVLYSQWLSDSEGKGASRGFIVMGNLLGTQMLSDALQTKVGLTLNPAQDVANSLSVGGKSVYSVVKAKEVESAIGVFGQDKKLLASIDFETPRNLILAAQKTLIAIVIAVFVGLVVMASMLAMGIRTISVKRIQKLESFVRDYQNGAKLSPSVAKGQDEIASLARAFERLVRDLSAAEEELSKKSYLQGKADSAAGMLHNVRNALAPVRVMQEKWLREETLPFRTNMQKAVDELAQEGLDPKRRADLEQFVVSAARTIAVSTKSRLSEMEEIKSSVDQIAEILGSYNFDMSATSAGEQIDIRRLLIQRFNQLDYRDGEPTKLVLPGQIPEVYGNRVHLIQVLDNLLVNAHEAMTAARVAEKRLDVLWSDVGDSQQIAIRITDNGDGIAPENIPQAFNRGYSTRHHKAGGLGMHWSANAMRAMGGSIALESPGIGQGATAILTLKRSIAAKSDEKLAA